MFCPSNARFITHRKGARWGNDAPGQPALRGSSLTSAPPSACYPTGSWALSETDHPFREVGIGAMPAVTSQQAGYANFVQYSPSTRALARASAITQTRARPYTTLHRGPLTLLKMISACRLPYLPPPGQPSLTTNVSCLLPSPSQPPSILQAHRGTIAIGVACWSDEVLQAARYDLAWYSGSASLQRIAFSHPCSCLGHRAS